MKSTMFFIKTFSSLLIICLYLTVRQTFAQENQDFLDKVILDESSTRYNLYYDKNGNYPDGFEPERLKGNIKAGDEIVVEFYPNSIFKLDLDITDTPKPADSINSFIIYPENQKDTFSIQYGYGEVYFATTTTGKYELRIASDSTKLKIGEEGNYDLIKKESGKYNPVCKDDFEKIFHDNGWSDNLKIWVFKNVFFEKGIYCMEVYQRADSVIKLLSRIKSVSVEDIYQNPSLIIQNDISNSISIPLEKEPLKGCYRSKIGKTNTTAGVLSFNICFDYAKDSWQYKQAPLEANNKKLFYENKSIVINKVKELPNSIRIRAGFGILDNLREVRLISNFVLIMNPKNYFSASTPFLQCFNPTLGLQIGGTGNKDLVFLMGISFKLIKEGDFITGFRFNGDGNNWQIGKNFYFGITLDPGLFNQLTNKE